MQRFVYSTYKNCITLSMYVTTRVSITTIILGFSRHMHSWCPPVAPHPCPEHTFASNPCCSTSSRMAQVEEVDPSLKHISKPVPTWQQEDSLPNFQIWHKESGMPFQIWKPGGLPLQPNRAAQALWGGQDLQPGWLHSLLQDPNWPSLLSTATGYEIRLRETSQNGCPSALKMAFFNPQQQRQGKCHNLFKTSPANLSSFFTQKSSHGWGWCLVVCSHMNHLWIHHVGSCSVLSPHLASHRCQVQNPCKRVEAFKGPDCHLH